MSSPRKKSYDWCIFCGDANGQRTDEHSVPKALGGGLVLDGELVLKNATCSVCQEITFKVESRIMLEAFHGVDQHLPLPVPKKEKLRPVSYFKGNQEVTENFPKDDHFTVHAMPVLPRAGFMVNRGRPDTDFDFNGEWYYWSWQKDTEERAGRIALDFLIERKYSAQDLAKFFTKIAHCYAVYRLGFNFRPLARELLLGRSHQFAHLVGCHRRVIGNDSLHYLSLETVQYEGVTFYIVYVWLFCPADPTEEVPVFEVVVGHENTDKFAKKSNWSKRKPV